MIDSAPTKLTRPRRSRFRSAAHSALEQSAASAAFHAIAEEGVPFKAIAEVIGRRLNIPVVSKSPAQAADHFGWFTMFAGMDAPTSSARTRRMKQIAHRQRLKSRLSRPVMRLPWVKSKLSSRRCR